ncbi:hypothetical protein BOX15_Mlig007117g1 [Macrostomum lignano]|uniref:Uncharacterized protein n=2 Tax=Macrostomum lignano TaxID=282301 RepID=A0A267H7Y5_9PLAT|nr:hypothetical protein BOX15_Mlig007117g1 [Macrostomum lignano]
MDAKKFLELQGQIKQNNQDYLEFVSELDSWKAELDKKREKSLLNSQQQQQQQQNGSSENLPPVRNSLMKKKYKKKPKSKQETSEQQQQQKKKIAAYDYKAWDKFDVDKACEEVDAAKPASDEEYETDEEWEEERRKQLAESKKAAGNEAFKAGKFEEAVELYTKATQLNPESAVYFSNRAMALLKLERFAAAEADCCSALELDAKIVKAYYRRGQARQKLGKLPDALRDLEEALALEPNNKALQSEVKQLRIDLHPEKYATGEVEPIFDKPVSQRSKKPLVRVPIQEVSSAKSAQVTPVATATSERTAKDESKTVQTEQPVLTAADQSSAQSGVTLPSSSKPPAAQQTQPEPLPTPPETPYQFKSAYRSLGRRDPLAFCTSVLCAVPPDRLPALIGESLESDALLDMAGAFQAGLSADPAIAPRVYQCLRLIADRVRRFATCVAFLSSGELGRLAQLISQLAGLLQPLTAAGDAQYDLTRLAAAYGVPHAV